MRQHVFRWRGLASPAEDHPEPVPPRPQRQDPGPVTAPRLWAPGGPLDAEWDPVGRPHPPLVFRSKEEGAAS